MLPYNREKCHAHPKTISPDSVEMKQITIMRRAFILFRLHISVPSVLFFSSSFSRPSSLSTPPPSISPSSYIFFFPSVSLDLSYPVPPFCRLHQFLPFAFRSFAMNFSKEKFDCGILSRRSFFHFHRFSVPL